MEKPGFYVLSLKEAMRLFKRYSQYSDEALAEAYYRSGDRSMLNGLFERYLKTVFGVCLFYFRDKAKASDASQQIFEKLILELRRTEVKHVKAWLSFVVRNHCISELRKLQTHRLLPEEYLEFEVEETDLPTEERLAAVSEDDLIHYLQQSLPTLKPAQRQCIELFYLKGKSYKEIEEQTGYQLKEVKSYIQNGKRNLKLLIEEKKKNENKHAN